MHHTQEVDPGQDTVVLVHRARSYKDFDVVVDHHNTSVAREVYDVVAVEVQDMDNVTDEDGAVEEDLLALLVAPTYADYLGEVPNYVGVEPAAMADLDDGRRTLSVGAADVADRLGLVAYDGLEVEDLSWLVGQSDAVLYVAKAEVVVVPAA